MVGGDIVMVQQNVNYASKGLTTRHSEPGERVLYKELFCDKLKCNTFTVCLYVH